MVANDQHLTYCTIIKIAISIIALLHHQTEDVEKISTDERISVLMCGNTVVKRIGTFVLRSKSLTIL